MINDVVHNGILSIAAWPFVCVVGDSDKAAPRQDREREVGFCPVIQVDTHGRMTPKPEMGRFAYRARYLAGNPLLTTFALHRRDERLFKAVAPEGESTGLIKSFFPLSIDISWPLCCPRDS
jgi:hypothetical protein